MCIGGRSVAFIHATHSVDKEVGQYACMYTLYRKYMQYGSLLRTHPEPMAWLKLEHKLAYGRLIFGHIIISLNSRRFLKWRLNEQHANWRSATTAASWMRYYCDIGTNLYCVSCKILWSLLPILWSKSPCMTLLSCFMPYLILALWLWLLEIH